MLHNMQHHFLCNISFVVIVASMGIDLKYTTIKSIYSWYNDNSIHNAQQSVDTKFGNMYMTTPIGKSLY